MELVNVNNTICKPAQEHLFISSQGYLAPCCFIKDASTRLQDVQDPVTWFYQNDTQYHLRQNLNNKIKDSRCSECWQKESEGKWSLRTNENGDNYQGSQPSLRLLHIVGGRLCNLACRMCYADLSSMVQQEQRPWELSHADGSAYNWIDYGDNIKKLIQLANVDTLQELQLQGGEPQLIKGFVKLLENIPDSRKAQLQVQVTSNATLFNEQFWQQIYKFDRVIIGLSIDAVASRYNTIRYKGDWTETERSVKQICNYLAKNRQHNFSMNMNVVQQLGNVDQGNHLDNFLDTLNKTHHKLKTNFTIMPIGHNPCWDLHNVPKEILQKEYNLIYDNSHFAKVFKTNILTAINNNTFEPKHAKAVVDREDWFKTKYNKCLWQERPDWKQIYEKNC